MHENQNNQAKENYGLPGREPGTLLGDAVPVESEAISIEEGKDAPVKTYPTPADEKGYYFASEKDEQDVIVSRIYPSPVQEDGYFCENFEEDKMGILTSNEGGKYRKKYYLPSDNTECITRKGKGHDAVKAQDLATSKKGEINELKYISAVQSITTRFNDKHKTMEDILDMDMHDFNTVIGVGRLLNF